MGEEEKVTKKQEKIFKVSLWVKGIKEIRKFKKLFLIYETQKETRHEIDIEYLSPYYKGNYNI